MASIHHVLVADDNPLSLRFLVDALELLGVGTVAVDDGTSAVRAAAGLAFDLLLFDAGMPQLGGADALARIRSESGPSRHAIALATTADNTTDTHVGLLDAGFAAVLLKPLAIDDLRDALAVHGHLTFTGVGEPGFDDRQALAAAGGDRTIVAALRGLLLRELEALPAELKAIAARGDTDALRARLHRLDASAGFCGMPMLVHASSDLRSSTAAGVLPRMKLRLFLDACAQCARLLAAG